MSLTADKARQDRPEVIARVNKIVEIMRDSWDTPADCNDGELFTYAEVLLDRLEARDDRDRIDLYLAEVQTRKLGMPASDAHRDILNHAITLINASL
jgi:hypothetical protein